MLALLLEELFNYEEAIKLYNFLIENDFDNSLEYGK